MTGSGPSHLLRRLFRLETHEAYAVSWSAIYMFCLLSGYYVLRSVRDEIGSEHVDQLPEVWLSVFFVVLAMMPLYAAVASRWPRRVFIPIAIRFFNVQLVVLFVLLHSLEGEARGYAEWVFYVWLSVFVMFVVSVFWGFMADLFRSEQGKRLFGLIAFGGSVGGVVGPLATAALVETIGQVNLFLIPIVLLEFSCLCVRRLNAWGGVHALVGGKEGDQQPVPGGIFHGFVVVFRNPYLLGIACYLFLYTYGSTMIYFQKAEISRAVFENRDARTAFYAQVDLVVNTLALLTQLFLTGRILPRLGVARTLMIVPLLTVVGFAALGYASQLDASQTAKDALVTSLWVLAVFEVVRRSANFALAKPTREVLFTVVSREEKYKSKAFLDTVVYRGSDVVNGYVHEGLSAGLGMGLSAVAYVAAPVAAVWVMVARFVGKRQDVLARTQPDAPADG